MSSKITDEFSHLPVSHQRKTQLRYQRDGKCIICGKKVRKPGALLCKEHHEKKNERQRQTLGYKKWQPGKPGRPPVDKVKKK